MRSFLIRTLAALGLLAAITPASAQSDFCVSAPIVDPGTYSGTTEGATNDGTASCGASDFSADVWYKFVAPSAGLLRVETCGSGTDTVLSIQEVCGGPSIVCNDNGGFTCNPASRTQTPTSGPGAEYLIRVAGATGNTVTYTLRIIFSEAGTGNDECAGATPIGNETVTGSTGTAHLDGYSLCGPTGAAPDVWYVYTAPQSCMVQFDLCGSAYDTVISLFDRCPNDFGVELTCSDDAEGPCGTASTMRWAVTQGESYIIRVGGFNNNSGGYTLNITPMCPPPGPDTCAEAMFVFAGTTDSNNMGATTDGASTCGGQVDAWFYYMAFSPEVVTVSTCTTSVDTIVSVHTACPGTAANQVACDDAGCGLGSSVTFNAPTDSTHYIRVAGAGGQTGTFTLYIETMPAPQCDGDVNCDSALNGGDVEVQELAVGGDITDYCQPDPDFNGDFALNGGDVEAVEVVVGGGPCP